MAWYPDAVRKPLTVPNRARNKVRMSRPVRINFHTAVSNSTSIFGFFNSTGAKGVFSHFYVRKDGTVEQYQDTDYRAACDLDGNADTISIETWDGYRSGYPGYWKNNSDVPPWNSAQIRALTKLARWIMRTHPSIPAKLATSNRKGTPSHGFSWHRLGIVGAPGFVSRANGGLTYSLVNGKVCPGVRRVNQVPIIFKAATSEVLSTQPNPVQEDIMAQFTPTDLAIAIQENARLAMLGVLETGRYAEYIDQDGNEKRDVRPLSDIIFATHAAAVVSARDSAFVKSMLAKQSGIDLKELAGELANELRPDLTEVAAEILSGIELPESSPPIDELAEAMIDKLAARLAQEV